MNILQTSDASYIKRFFETLKKGNRYITCDNTSDCLDYVKNGNAVYSAV